MHMCVVTYKHSCFRVYYQSLQKKKRRCLNCKKKKKKSKKEQEGITKKVNAIIKKIKGKVRKPSWSTVLSAGYKYNLHQPLALCLLYLM